MTSTSNPWRTSLASSILAVSLWLGAGAVSAQTVGETAKLSEAQQLQIVQRFVDTAVTNLSSPKELDGKPKDPAAFKRERAMANLTRALFNKDTRPDSKNWPPEGPRVMLSRIKKYSTATPERKVVDVMGELVEWSYGRFYSGNELLKGEKLTQFDARSDADQEAWFRIFIQMYENDRAHEKLQKQLAAQDAAIVRQLAEMYDNSVVLADGRHVLRTQSGEFMVITKDPNDRREVKLDAAHYAEAQSMFSCKQAKGIANGEAARKACSGAP